MRVKSKYPITIGMITYPTNTIFDAEWLRQIEKGEDTCTYTRMLIEVVGRHFEIERCEVDIVYN